MRDCLGLLLRTLLAVSFISLALVFLGAETNNGAPVRIAARDIGKGAPVVVAMKEPGNGPRSGGDIGPGAPYHGTIVGNR